MLQKELENKLSAYRDPYLNQDLISMGAVRQINIAKDHVELNIAFSYPNESIKAEITHQLHALLSPLVKEKPLKINLLTNIIARANQQGLPALPSIKNIIAVGSGKGGVGKSTVAVNLAIALAKEGAHVGLLDADIYGPSQPAMLGVANQKPVIKDKSIHPIKSHGIQSMSIGYLINENAPMVWRGPMLGKALQQLLHDTAWENLDYLIIDLPPGTGDIQLTLCQKVPVNGALIVTTPQDLALLDVKKACEMFNKLNVPILGIIENMSSHQCSQCGHQETIFGAGGGEKLAKQYGVCLLGSIPLDAYIRQTTDAGNPPVTADPENTHAKLFCEIARKSAAQLSLQPKNYSAKFPKIVVE